MATKEEFEKLIALKELIENPLFQERIAKPMREYQDKQKNAYSCETLKELWEIKGKKDGSEEFFRILKHFYTEYKNTKYEFEHSEEGIR